MQWERKNNGNYYNIDNNDNIEYQLNKIKDKTWILSIYTKEEIRKNKVKELINDIDLSLLPISYNKLFLISNNQEIQNQFFRSFSNLLKEIGYLDGRPFPVIKKPLNSITEESILMKDNFIDIVYYNKDGNIKFKNYTYDYDWQVYKCILPEFIEIEDLKSTLSQFIKLKEPNAIYIDNEGMRKRMKEWFEERDYELQNSAFINSEK